MKKWRVNSKNLKERLFFLKKKKDWETAIKQSVFRVPIEGKKALFRYYR
jgi:hypothetical protein